MLGRRLIGRKLLHYLMRRIRARRSNCRRRWPCILLLYCRFLDGSSLSSLVVLDSSPYQSIWSMTLDVDQNSEEVQKCEKPEMRLPLLSNHYRNKASNSRKNSKKMQRIKNKVSSRDGRQEENLGKSSPSSKPNMMPLKRRLLYLILNSNLLTLILSFPSSNSS